MEVVDHAGFKVLLSAVWVSSAESVIPVPLRDPLFLF